MKLFGTDGVRGLVNKELDSILALKLGASVAHILKQELKKDKLTFLIGGDTRISHDMLKSAVISGFLSEGCNVVDTDIIPTPAISYLITKYNLDGGFVISASHNPVEYNGIKVFNNLGYKWHILKVFITLLLSLLLFLRIFGVYLCVSLYTHLIN